MIQADGGTRTASITGAFVAMADAFREPQEEGVIASFPVKDLLAATSVGIVDGQTCLDLCFEEDSAAQVDMNVVMTGTGKFVELQGTGEGSPFTSDELVQMLDLARRGIQQLIEYERELFGDLFDEIGEAVEDADDLGKTWPWTELIIATRNSHKVRELNALSERELGLPVVGLDRFSDVPEVVEDGDTFEGTPSKRRRRFPAR